jgi:hypothetical protein
VRLAKWLGLCVLLLLVLREVFFSGPYLPLAKPHDGLILDMHCHVAGIGAGGSGCFVSRKLRNNFRFNIYMKAFGVTLAEVEKQGDQLLVEHLAKGIEESKRVGAAIVLAMDGVVDANGRLDLSQTEFYIPNEFVAAETVKHPKLYFGASVNPHRPDALERLQWVRDNGALLVKWLPSIQFIDPADPALEPFYRKMVALNLPLLTHAGQERSFTHARDELADPVRLKLPLSLGVKVIVAHAAFGGRLLYGSDFPLINTAVVSPWFYPLNLTRKQMQSIGAIENPWDRDVALKEALGVPADVMGRSAYFFGVPLGQSAAD